MLHASDLVVHDDGVEVARHERLMIKAGVRLVLDHDLKALVRKARSPARVDRAETGVGVRLNPALAGFADALGAGCHDVSCHRHGRILKIANRWLRWLEFPVQVASRTRGGGGRGWHPLGTGRDRHWSDGARRPWSPSSAARPAFSADHPSDAEPALEPAAAGRDGTAHAVCNRCVSPSCHAGPCRRDLRTLDA
ncbi:hypothetical protein [Streptomyces sp. NBC_00390]|uniref:hypothetical protein n=1 Tax=Streptomyces sp. NBC_00390 TaxID=2975736 RepID=UPI003FCED44C